MPDRNRRWRKSHHNKNLTAPRSSEREDCENYSSADRRLADRQLVLGIQIGDLSVYMLRLPSYRKLRRFIGKRIALLSACWEQRFSFLNSHVSIHVELSASLECGGLAPLCSRAERAIPEVKRAALRAVTKRRQAAALQGGAQFKLRHYPQKCLR